MAGLVPAIHDLPRATKCVEPGHDGPLIKARDGESHDPRPKVSDAAGKTFRRVRADLIKDPKRACADYGDASVDRGLLRRY